MIKYKNNPKIDCDELLKAKQNLKIKEKNNYLDYLLLKYQNRNQIQNHLILHNL